MVPPHQQRTVPSLASLPDDLLLRCLALLSLEERFRSASLVSKRFRTLCLAPQLLHVLKVNISGAQALPRSASLLRFFAAHAAHVRSLTFDVSPATGGNEHLPLEQCAELTANVAGCLSACAAVGHLKELDVSGTTPVPSTAWLPALSALQVLHLGDARRPLRLPAGLTQLTALKRARLAGSPLTAEGCLPGSLRELRLNENSSTEVMQQVSHLTGLVSLYIKGDAYTAAGMECLTALTSLQRLQAVCTALPLSLPAMTQLESLGVTLRGDAWLQTFQAALPRLTRLTLLALSSSSPHTGQVLPAITQLQRLQRLGLSSLGGPAELPPLPPGPWLASLRWLGLPWRLLQASVPALEAALALEYLCCFDFPAVPDAADSQQAWLAAWEFLATHPPLRCFNIGWALAPSPAVFDATLRLSNRRPGLLLFRFTVSEFANQLWTNIEVPSANSF